MHRVLYFAKVNVMPTSGRNNLYSSLRNLFKRFQTTSSTGFTLIELLIVTALIGILSTIVLANYNSFGGRQKVRDAAENFKSDLRKYQNFAISGQKNPIQNGACAAETLQFYRVVVNSGGYDVTAVCTGGVTISLPSVAVPAGVVIGPGCGEIRFLPLNQGTEVCTPLASSNTFSFGGDANYDVIVNDSGEIQLTRP